MNPSDDTQSPAIELTPEEEATQCRIDFVHLVIDTYKDFTKTLTRIQLASLSRPELRKNLLREVVAARAKDDQRIAEEQQNDPSKARLMREVQAINDAIFKAAILDVGMVEAL